MIFIVKVYLCHWLSFPHGLACPPFAFYKSDIFCKSTLLTSPITSWLTSKSLFLTLDPQEQCLTSTIYGLFDSFNTSPLAHIKSSWEAEVGTELSEKMWNYILDLVQLILKLCKAWLVTVEDSAENPPHQCCVSKDLPQKVWTLCYYTHA